MDVDNQMYQDAIIQGITDSCSITTGWGKKKSCLYLLQLKTSLFSTFMQRVGKTVFRLLEVADVVQIPVQKESSPAWKTPDASPSTAKSQVCAIKQHHLVSHCQMAHV